MPRIFIIRQDYLGFTQENCPDGYVMNAQGVCVEEGLDDPLRAKKPPFPFRPTTGPFDPMGARQVQAPECLDDADCGKGQFCQGGLCYSSNPGARENMYAPCDTYTPSCPGPRGSANYRSRNGQCCGKGAPRQTLRRRRR